MGMMINRRRVMGKKEDTYIQDGLVFWLDGINKGDDPTAWTDLVGHKKFANSGAVSEDTYFFFKENAYMEGPELRGSQSSCTIECCFAPVSTFTGMVFQTANGGSDPKNGCMYLHLNQGLFFDATRVYNLIRNIGNNTVSLNNVFGIQNGQILSRGASTDYWVGESKFFIGKNGNNRFYYTGKIYAIRIYNRVLTQEEVLHNQRLDNIRFNLGINI